MELRDDSYVRRKLLLTVIITKVEKTNCHEMVTVGFIYYSYWEPSC